jgi:hypothetical protein
VFAPIKENIEEAWLGELCGSEPLGAAAVSNPVLDEQLKQTQREREHYKNKAASRDNTIGKQAKRIAELCDENTSLKEAVLGLAKGLNEARKELSKRVAGGDAGQWYIPRDACGFCHEAKRDHALSLARVAECECSCGAHGSWSEKSSWVWKKKVVRPLPTDVPPLAEPVMAETDDRPSLLSRFWRWCRTGFWE